MKKSIGRVSVSMLNQIVSSGANFAFGLYLVRELVPYEFGLYGICMAICLLYAGSGNALFLTQMVVHLPDKGDRGRSDYTASILGLVGIYCLITMVLVGAICMLATVFNWAITPILQLIMATAAASVANLLKNYFVRLAYSLKQEAKSLQINLVWAAILFVLLMASYQSAWISNASAAMWIFASTSFIASLHGMVLLPIPLKRVELNKMRKDFEEARAGGVWALGGVAVTWMQSQSYMYVTTFLVGPAGLALANAARMLIAPFTFILPALTQLFLPHLAEERNKNVKNMFRAAELYTAFLAGLGVVYLMILWLGMTKLIPIFVGDRYSIEDVRPLVIAWGAVLLFQLVRDGSSLALQALKAFRRLMLANALTAVIAITATIGLAKALGISGAILGVGVAELLLAIMLWRNLKRVKKSHAS